MEAFGNAKTVRNDNSSRFGKYIDIRFTEAGNIQGANIEQYLLEKSRIVSQNQDERNYHIFYCMLAGLTAEERKKLELTEQSASKYVYLSQGACTTLKGKNDMKDFADIRSAMQVLSFKPEEVWNIFSLLAAILHLGNLQFKATEIQNMACSEVNDVTNVNRVATLLGVTKDDLCSALVQKTILVHGETVVTALSKESALEGRDAFVKSLYGGIFERIMEQQEYENEHINWQHIDFQDNQEILDLIGMKSVNIMSLIDEESKFPKGTDQTLLEKLHVQHGNRSIYVKPKSSQNSIFGIRHYAGVVMYNTHGFLEKNRDSFSMDLAEMIQKSKNKFLKDVFPQTPKYDTMKKQLTLSVKFRNSLDLLMRTLSSAHPFFIRCIKPNENKLAN
ncbi:hypothetical protein DOY81_015327, partial [Sarcophaga bullata]